MLLVTGSRWAHEASDLRSHSKIRLKPKLGMGGGGNSMGLSSTHRVAKRSSFRKSTGIPVMIKAHGHATCYLVGHTIKSKQRIMPSVTNSVQDWAGTLYPPIMVLFLIARNSRRLNVYKTSGKKGPSLVWLMYSASMVFAAARPCTRQSTHGHHNTPRETRNEIRLCINAQNTRERHMAIIESRHLAFRELLA